MRIHVDLREYEHRSDRYQKTYCPVRKLRGEGIELVFISLKFDGNLELSSVHGSSIFNYEPVDMFINVCVLEC